MNGQEGNKMNAREKHEARNEDVFLIQFSDLIPEVQKQLLEFMGIEDLAELNWDVFPVAEVLSKRGI
jgi:hypothetical protein